MVEHSQGHVSIRQSTTPNVRARRCSARRLLLLLDERARTAKAPSLAARVREVVTDDATRRVYKWCILIDGNELLAMSSLRSMMMKPRDLGRSVIIDVTRPGYKLTSRLTVALPGSGARSFFSNCSFVTRSLRPKKTSPTSFLPSASRPVCM